MLDIARVNGGIPAPGMLAQREVALYQDNLVLPRQDMDGWACRCTTGALQVLKLNVGRSDASMAQPT